MAKENLPLENYFAGRLVSIELTTYATRYRPVFLQTRTDPLAVRGEKLFVQNCTSCHNSASVTELSGETHARHLASSGHPIVKSLPTLQERDRRALVSYLNAYRLEHGKPPQ